MNRSRATLAILALLLLAPSAFAEETAMDRLKTIRAASRHAIVYVHDAASTAGKERALFDEAAAKLAARADALPLDVADTRSADLVKEFGLDRAPLPLVLVIAPNGVATGGHPAPFTVEAIEKSLAGPGTADCMKALQERKLLLLCLSSGVDAADKNAFAGALEFSADAQYAPATTIVRFARADSAEAELLRNLGVDPAGTTPVTVFVGPPGVLIGSFEGGVSKAQLQTALMSKMSGGCGPSSGGCGPSSGGCGPSGCK